MAESRDIRGSFDEVRALVDDLAVVLDEAEQRYQSLRTVAPDR